MKDISFHITDITENCIRAGADRIDIGLSVEGNKFELSVADNGSGMSEETVRKATNPFYTTRTTRKIGLGLPFLIQNAEQSGGGVTIESEIGVGTSVRASFMLDNIDCPPMGDLADTLMLLITGNPTIDTHLTLACDGGSFRISTSDLKEILDGVPLGHPEVATMVKEIIGGNIDEIFGDRLKV